MVVFLSTRLPLLWEMHHKRDRQLDPSWWTMMDNVQVRNLASPAEMLQLADMIYYQSRILQGFSHTVRASLYSKGIVCGQLWPQFPMTATGCLKRTRSHQMGYQLPSCARPFLVHILHIFHGTVISNLVSLALSSSLLFTHSHLQLPIRFLPIFLSQRIK